MADNLGKMPTERDFSYGASPVVYERQANNRDEAKAVAEGEIERGYAGKRSYGYLQPPTTDAEVGRTRGRDSR